jgi:hypothetical protein
MRLKRMKAGVSRSFIHELFSLECGTLVSNKPDQHEQPPRNIGVQRCAAVQDICT